jgi:hypothetical protein
MFQLSDALGFGNAILSNCSPYNFGSLNRDATASVMADFPSCLHKHVSVVAQVLRQKRKRMVGQLVMWPILWLEHPVSVDISLRAGVNFRIRYDTREATPAAS